MPQNTFTGRNTLLCDPSNRERAGAGAMSMRLNSIWLRNAFAAPARNEGSSIFDGAPREIRTPDLLVRSQTLYPTELGARLGSGSLGSQSSETQQVIN